MNASAAKRPAAWIQPLNQVCFLPEGWTKAEAKHSCPSEG